MCGVLSLVVHAALLLAARGGHAAAGSAWGSPRLDVALVSAPSDDTPPTVAQPVMPTRLDLSTAKPIRDYPKLLPFSPIAPPPPRFDELAYRPLSKVTVPPTAAKEIVIDYPQAATGAELMVASLTLFIDEDGTVAKVRVEEPRAPHAYEAAAVEAFANARFRPGMAGPEAVKTRMVIRVAFESGPTGPLSSAGIRVK